MADGMEIFVGNQSVTIRADTQDHTVDMNVPQYPVEQGDPLTDHTQIEKNAFTVSGWVIGKTWEEADNMARQLYIWQKNSQLVSIRNGINETDLIIQNWKKLLDEPTSNGFKVEVTMIRVRLPQSAYTKRNNAGSRQPSQGGEVWLTVQPGNTYWAWSMRYGTSIPQLRAWNRYPDRFIPIGVRVRVK